MQIKSITHEAFKNYAQSSFRKIISNKLLSPTILYVPSSEILNILNIYFTLKNFTISPNFTNYNLNSIYITDDKKERYKPYDYINFSSEAK